VGVTTLAEQVNVKSSGLGAGRNGPENTGCSKIHATLGEMQYNFFYYYAIFL
jgi:hypothetical protein